MTGSENELGSFLRACREALGPAGEATSAALDRPTGRQPGALRAVTG